jgi:hypothetical protein
MKAFSFVPPIRDVHYSALGDTASWIDNDLTTRRKTSRGERGGTIEKQEFLFQWKEPKDIETHTVCSPSGSHSSTPRRR